METLKTKITKTHWCPDNNRYITIIQDENGVVGLNYMEGCDYEMFKEHSNEIDTDLTLFYKSVEDLVKETTVEERVNKIISSYIEYINCY